MVKLFVGGDESNHSGDSRGEIIVAAFSTLPQDITTRPFPNRRDYVAQERWLAHPQRDYLAGILGSEKYRNAGDNLIRGVPDLVKEYLLRNDMHPNSIKVYLDGGLTAHSRKNLTDSLHSIAGVSEITIGNFVKKRKTSNGNVEKRPRCPALVYYADIIASYLNSLSAQELFSHPNLVFIR